MVRFLGVKTKSKHVCGIEAWLELGPVPRSNLIIICVTSYNSDYEGGLGQGKFECESEISEYETLVNKWRDSVVSYF